MNSNLTDLSYATGQLVRIIEGDGRTADQDAAQRALDAIERIKERLERADKDAAGKEAATLARIEKAKDAPDVLPGMLADLQQSQEIKDAALQQMLRVIREAAERRGLKLMEPIAVHDESGVTW